MGLVKEGEPWVGAARGGRRMRRRTDKPQPNQDAPPAAQRSANAAGRVIGLHSKGGTNKLAGLASETRQERTAEAARPPSPWRRGKGAVWAVKRQRGRRRGLLRGPVRARDFSMAGRAARSVPPVDPCPGRPVHGQPCRPALICLGLGPKSTY